MARSELWKTLPILIQWTLNTKHFHGNDVPAVPYAIDPAEFTEIPTENKHEYFNLFKEEKDLWNQLSYQQQIGFNNFFGYKGNFPLTASPSIISWLWNFRARFSPI